MIPLIIFAVLIAFIVYFLASLYNKLVALRNRYKADYKQIDVQLKRRYDLIPNLVESAKGYLTHESKTLEAVISARNNAFDASKLAAANPGNASAMAGLMQAEGALGAVMGKLLAVVESYPNLKANETISQLMEELTATENKISFARQVYNDDVAEYNTNREQFPNNVLFNFAAAELLESVEKPEDRQAPKVSFK